MPDLDDFPEERHTAEEAAAFLGLAPHTLAVDRCNGRLGYIPYFKVGRKVYYQKKDLRIWLASRRRHPPPPPDEDPDLPAD